jgi:hypothetical protein
MLFIATATTYAQTATDCANLMKFGVYDKFRTFTTESHYQQVREFFENNTFSSRQQAEQKAGELGLQIDGILGLNLGGSTSSLGSPQMLDRKTARIRWWSAPLKWERILFDSAPS